MDDIMVSVLCTSYNQEKYIRKCLDGFVMQKTNFKYEVIIHDDASTDGTQDIIREYAEKYPDIIKPIYQTENQYSQGVKMLRIFMYPKVRGDYIAFCEGDDFWTDTLKLQKQFDCLEAHTDANMCVHTVQAVKESGDLIPETYPPKPFASKSLSSKEFFEIELPVYSFQTSSYFIRKETYDQYISSNEEYIRIAPTGDWPMLLFFGLHGNIYYINDTMSCYRRGSVASFNTLLNKSDLNSRLKVYNGWIDMINSFDEITDKQYHSDVLKFIDRIESHKYYSYLECREFKKLLKIKYLKYFKNESFKDKISIVINAYFPRLTKKLFN